MKQNTLIAIMGIHDQGKTATVNFLVDMLKGLPRASLIHSVINSRLNKYIIELGGLKIGLLDSDYPDPMVDAITEFITVHHCEIIICRSCYLQLPCKVNGFIDDYVLKAGYRVFKTTNYSIKDKKPHTPLHDALNLHSATQLLHTMKAIISGSL